MAKHTVIYTRFTDPKQREESNEAQERKVRQHFEYLKIDHANALVLKDSAQRGDLEDRACYDRLLQMIRAGEVAVLGVDQQSRFSRGFNVRALIQDLAFTGGRFVSAAEGIDTERPGWQDLVGIKEIHNQMEIRDTGWRVRRSQEQRIVKPNGSAGDYCYGYRSDFENPAEAANYRGRGPKPAKRVIIDDAAAAVVVEVFEHFAIRGQSIGQIVRWWEANKERFPRITKSKIHHEHVRRILKSKKYIGIWEYGRTTTLRNSAGKKKQVKPFSHQAVTVVQRPDLRIISQELWEKAQQRLAKLQEIYGMRQGGKRRGPSQHYRLLYETRLIDGLVHCGACVERGETKTCMHISASNGVKRFGCPRHKSGVCPMIARVPYDAVEKAIAVVIENTLLNYPAFIACTFAHTCDAIRQLTSTAPGELDAERKRLARIEFEIANLVRVLAAGAESPAVRAELTKLEAEKSQVVGRIGELTEASHAEVTLPDEMWVKEQLTGLVSLLHKNGPEAIQLMRSMIGQIIAEEVKIPGKRRGYVRIRFRIDGTAALIHILASKLPRSVLAAFRPADTESARSDEFVIDLGAPTTMDTWGPKIIQWRKEKVRWHEICRRTDLTLASAFIAYKRCRSNDQTS